MSKVSLIIPTLHVADCLEKCIESFNNQYDELIVVDDTDISLAKKINKGLRLATGDFLIVSNDDVLADQGTLRDLCVDDRVLSPKVNGGVFKVFHAHMFCLPRKVYGQVGGYDESYDGAYWIDSEYWYRLIQTGNNPDIHYEVNIKHEHPATTIGTLSEKERNEADGRAWFVSKYGVDALRTVGA